MKRKLLCIAVAVIMILPLAFAAIPMASAAVSIYETSSGTATLTDYQSDNWDFQDLQGIGSANDAAAVSRVEPSTFYVNSETKAFGVSSNAWIAGMISSKKMFDFSSEITAEVVIGDMVHEPTAGHTVFPEQAHTIVLSAAKPYVYAVGYSERNSYEGIEVRFSENANGKIDGYFNINNGAAVYKPDLFVAGDVVNFTFVNTGADIEVYAQKADEEKALIYTFVGGAALFADEAAFLAFTAQTYGGAVTQPMTVNKVNGTAALDAAGTITPVAPFDPTDAAWTNKVAAAGMSAGTVTYDTKGNLNLAAPGGWWSQAGVSYNNKVKVDGLKIKFNLSSFSAPVGAYNTYFAVTVHQSPIGDFGIGSLVGARAYSLCPVDTNGFSASFAGGGLGLFVDAVNGSANFLDAYNVVAGEDSTLEFKVEDGVIKFYVNGTKVTFVDDKTGETVDYAVDATNILDEDGMAYLAFSVVGEGGYTAAATIKSVNGVTTGYYNGADTYTDHKASTPVVQWRAPEEGVAAGLRFKTTVALNNVNNNDSIVKMGTIIMPADKVTGGYLGHTQDGKIDGTSYLDIVAKNYYEKTDDSISFTAVLIGIPEDQLDRIFLAVSYVEYADGTITYGGLRPISINDAMNA